jgi:T5SS/PEP-CTERM-associated repeat protein/autotransporter-associated beta strand protein
MNSSVNQRTSIEANKSKTTCIAIGLAFALALIPICLASPTQAAITWTGDLDPADPTAWTYYSTFGYIGKTSTGSITVDGASELLCRDGYLGYNPGSIGTATVTGAGSRWNISRNLYVGKEGSGTLTVKDGGTVVVNSIFASLDSLLGDGTISTSGGVLDADLIFDAAYGSSNTFTFGSSGILTYTLSSFYSNVAIGAGYKGNGTLRIADGIQISSSYGYLGYNSGSTGTATVTGNGSRWICGYFYVGYSGTGTLNIEDGAQSATQNPFGLGYNSGSTGTITVSGTGSKLSSYSLNIGESGTGILNVKSGGLVSSSPGCIGYNSGSVGTATVTGTGSNWTMDGDLQVGGSGTGTLSIESGGTVSGYSGFIGRNSGSTGTVTVTDAGSTWNMGSLYIGNAGTGTLNIKAGGLVSSRNSNYIGYQPGSSGTVNVSGAGSKWNSDWLDIGSSGTGTLNIEDGGLVGCSSCYIKNGTVSLTNAGSLQARVTLSLGSGATLNIGDGIASDCLVSAQYMDFSPSVTAPAICNLNGGTIQFFLIVKKTNGIATINWNDGTIRNLDASTDLGIAIVGESGITLKLAATGTHAFYIDAGRKGIVRTVLRDATSGGTLEKRGDGLLMLSSANTYTGGTTIAAGTLALDSTGSLASSPIDVQSGATFDISAKSGYSIDAGKTLTGSGTIIGDLSISGIHAPGSSIGVETVKGNYSLLGELQIELAGTTVGTGYDEVLISGSSVYKTTLSGTLSLDWTGFTGSTDATRLWILKNDTAGTLSGAFSNYANGACLGFHDGRSWYLSYNANAATGKLTGGNDVLIAPVPEPATIVLLALSALAALLWRRKM